MLVTTSPGLSAVLLGMFSHVGIKPTTFMAGCKAANASKVPSTLAAPHMSNFISSMPGPGLSEIPPVSKVMPLPTSTVGATVFAAPAYCKTMKRNGSLEPWATAAKEPIPSFSTSLGPSTWHLIRDFLAKLCAARANIDGVAWLAGRLPHSLASATPWAKAVAVANALLRAFTFSTVGKPTVTRLSKDALADGLVVVNT